MGENVDFSFLLDTLYTLLSDSPSYSRVLIHCAIYYYYIYYYYICGGFRVAFLLLLHLQHTTHAPGVSCSGCCAVLSLLSCAVLLLSNSNPLEPHLPHKVKVNPKLPTVRDLDRTTTTTTNARTPPVTYTANSVALQPISKGSSTRSRPHLALQIDYFSAISHPKSLIMSPGPKNCSDLAQQLPRITLPYHNTLPHGYRL